MARYKKIKLYSYWRSSATYRVRIALNLKKIGYQPELVHLLGDGGERVAEQYHWLNPQHRVPALQLDDGRVMTQSSTIIKYLDETVAQPPLLPDCSEGRVRMRSLAQLVGCDTQPLDLYLRS